MNKSKRMRPLTKLKNYQATIKIIIALMLLFVSISSLEAKKYYVSTSGSDSNTGTEKFPWKSIQHAADYVKGGDIVMVAPGDYVERVKSKQGGTSAKNRIIFIASPRREATVSGFDLYHDYIRIEGFQVTNDLTGENDYGIQDRGNHNEIIDNYLYNVRMIAINCSGDFTYIADNRIYKSQMGIVVSGKNWLVERNEIKRMFMYGTMDDADYLRFFGENGIVRKNYFYGSTAAETDPAHLDCFQTYDVSGFSVKNITIENNICLDCDQGVMATATKINKSSDMLIKNNVFAHTLAWGVAVVGIRNVNIINNTFYDIRVYGAGIRGKQGINGTIKNNIFMNIGSEPFLIGEPANSIDYNFTFNCGIPKVTGPHDLVNQKDPMFKDAGSDDFRLLQGSPCVDAGDPADKVPQCGGKRIDIGAFEFCGENE